MQLTNDTTPAAETAINNLFLDEDFTERIIHVGMISFALPALAFWLKSR